MRIPIPSLCLTLAMAAALPAQAPEAKPAAPAAGATARAAAGATASAESLTQRGRTALEDKDWAAAAEAFRALADLQPKNPSAWLMLGFALHQKGDLDQALEAHRKAASFPATKATATYNVACAYALKQDKDQALDWLKKAADAGFRDVDHIGQDSDLASLRGDPRFAQLVETIAKMPAAVQVWAGNPERGNASLFLWGRKGPAGEVLISYGLPVWKESHDKVVAQATQQRWRVGKDFWTTCENSVPLRFGDVVVPPGYWYLTLEQVSSGKSLLAFNDPAPIRAQKLVAYLADRTEGGIQVAMAHERVDEVAERLRIELQSEGQPAGKLVIAFGPHRVAAPFTIEL